MLFLLDTNALSDLVRDNAAIRAALQSYGPEKAFTSVINRGELLFGVERLPPSRKRQELAAKVHKVLAAVPCEPVPAGAAEHYASIKATEGRNGIALDENDFWIAATALDFGATVVTRDADFARLGGLTVVDWSR